MKVRMAGIVNESVTDGPGIRIALFFQGCDHHCPGCHNPQTWPMRGGDEVEVDELITRLEDTPLVKGITLSGGDPFYQAEAAGRIAAVFKTRGKDVWAYTGFTWEELLREGDPARLALLKGCDVLVDGPYMQAQRDPRLPFRGSANQRIIAVSESLAVNKVVEWNANP